MPKATHRSTPFAAQLAATLLPSAVLLATLVTTPACIDTASLAVKSTAKVLERAAPSIQMEPDWQLAYYAIPGSLKTVEGFHLAQPDNQRLLRILSQGFCSYATGFIEDDWERAGIAGNFEEQEAQAKRATKAFTRCMNYALEQLPRKYTKAISGELQPFLDLVAKAKSENRDALMWLGVGLAGTINYNKTDIALVTQLPKALALLQRVIEIDDKHGQPDLMKHVLPHLALGRAYTARGAAIGGDPERGKQHFERAMALSKGRLFLVKVYYAAGYARITGNRKLFRRLLVEVLRSNPAIYPEQRLANEIGLRRARRYLKQEKEWF